MRVVYYADDGTEFKSEKECREHEKKMTSVFDEFKNSIHAYDDSGRIIRLDDNPEYWESALQDITYIRFDSQKAIDVFIEHAINEYGLMHISDDIHREVKVGERYFYDWDADGLACLEDRMNNLNKITEVFK